jgi:hypothetical protein
MRKGEIKIFLKGQTVVMSRGNEEKWRLRRKAWVFDKHYERLA